MRKAPSAAVSARPVALAGVLALAGCVAAIPEALLPAWHARAPDSASSNLVRAEVRTADFVLNAYSRGVRGAANVVVYIEGDGRAWRSRYRVSADPTPRNPIALHLASRDPSPAVLYLARPCQYLSRAALAGCDPRFWTGARYSETVVAALSAAIDAMLGPRLPAARARRIGLVGFSGGGTIAALLAARRDDVAWFVTIAANLDHRAWTAAHGVTPLAGSLNPVDAAARLRAIPQAHLYGGRDATVPFGVLDRYLQALGTSPRIVTRGFPRFDHRCCWESVWPRAACDLLEGIGERGFTPCAAAP